MDDEMVGKAVGASETRVGRRRLLAGGFLAGLGALFARGERAEAASGEPLILGRQNAAESPTDLFVKSDDAAGGGGGHGLRIAHHASAPQQAPVPPAGLVASSDHIGVVGAGHAVAVTFTAETSGVMGVSDHVGVLGTAPAAGVVGRAPGGPTVTATDIGVVGSGRGIGVIGATTPFTATAETAGVLGVSDHIGVVGEAKDVGVVGRGGLGSSLTVTAHDTGVVGSAGAIGVVGVAGRQTSFTVSADSTGVLGFADRIGVVGAVGQVATLTAEARVGVLGSSDSIGVLAHNPVGGLALDVSGRVRFSTAGKGAFLKGARDAAVRDPAVTAASLVMVTLLGDPGSSSLSWVELMPGEGFVAHLGGRARETLPFAYFIAES